MNGSQSINHDLAFLSLVHSPTQLDTCQRPRLPNTPSNSKKKIAQLSIEPSTHQEKKPTKLYPYPPSPSSPSSSPPQPLQTAPPTPPNAEPSTPSLPPPSPRCRHAIASPPASPRDRSPGGSARCAPTRNWRCRQWRTSRRPGRVIVGGGFPGRSRGASSRRCSAGCPSRSGRGRKR